jgi:hypothetical protein
MYHRLSIFLYNKLEDTVGIATASVIGVIAHRTFADILITLLIALCTGFLGYIGTHLAKMFLKYLKKSTFLK